MNRLPREASLAFVRVMNPLPAPPPRKAVGPKNAGGRLPYVVASVQGLPLAVSAGYVQEIVRVPPWHPVPNLPPHIRGVINLRGKVLPLVDLRLRLGLPSALEDVEGMIRMLVAREQDHVLWLKELRSAVEDGRAFTLARDPTECAFGKWYYTYAPEDIGFASVMCRLELPHRRIHALAEVVLKHADRGEHDQARALILQAERGDLRTVVNLFEEARTALRESQKEVALVLSTGVGKPVAVTVDAVISVEALAEDTITAATPAIASVRSDLIRQVAHRGERQEITFLLDAEALLADLRSRR